ncbi:high affinity immunoglobulin gamma Fc receptor I-like [Centroberyx affinis]|uniref:high affinity immunoglobulin gamma Fc receptor I-like n=1 Tax=Centroberyx affinis TaxID=166261 RepID=UPI003A5BF82B
MKQIPLNLILSLYVLQCCRPTEATVSLNVSPNSQQFFEAEFVSLSCEQSSAGWKVKRRGGGTEEECGGEGGFGRFDGSSCRLTVFTSDSGVYWCETAEGERSDEVHITVSGPVILEIPALPVMEGSDVTLRCRTKPSSSFPASFFRNNTFIGSGSEGEFTIRNVQQSDEGSYRCYIELSGQSPASRLSVRARPTTPPPTITPLSTCRPTEATVSLNVSPNSQQFFEAESVSLSCEQSSAGWKVKRRRGGGTEEECGGEGGFGGFDGSSCSMSQVFRSDSGVYWCETAEGERSDKVHITVSGPVILEIPALPVMEGSDVTLRCRTKPSSSFPASFFRNNTFIGSGSEGEFTISNVQQSDEGSYRCYLDLVGDSPDSWLSVRDSPPPPPPPPPPPSPLSVVRLLCHLVVFCPYCISTVLMVSLYRSRTTGNKPAVSMETAQRGGGDQGLDEEYDDIAADVTTEHDF